MQEADYILFETYLSGALDAKAQGEFEARLESDEVFKNAFETYKQATAFLENTYGNEAETEAFKKNLNAISEKHFTREIKTTKRIKPWYYSIAAAVVLLFGFFIAQQFSTPSYDDFASYHTISLSVRSEQPELISKAETAFNEKDFKAANGYFKQLLETNPDNLEFQLYQAVSMVELGLFDEADAIFGKLLETPSVYKNKAAWYLALSKLKQEDYRACVEVLKTIPEDAEDYKQAQKLLKKLD